MLQKGRTNNIESKLMLELTGAGRDRDQHHNLASDRWAAAVRVQEVARWLQLKLAQHCRVDPATMVHSLYSPWQCTSWLTCLLSHLPTRLAACLPLSACPRPRLDHLFGVFRTAAGRLRRMDVIVSAPAQLPFATIAWIGRQGAGCGSWLG